MKIEAKNEKLWFIIKPAEGEIMYDCIYEGSTLESPDTILYFKSEEIWKKHLKELGIEVFDRTNLDMPNDEFKELFFGEPKEEK